MFSSREGRGSGTQLKKINLSSVVLMCYCPNVLHKASDSPGTVTLPPASEHILSS